MKLIAGRFGHGRAVPHHSFYVYLPSCSFLLNTIAGPLSVIIRRKLTRHHRLPAMSKDDLRIRPFRKHMDHLVAALPIIMVACQPSLNGVVVVVVGHMVHIRGEDPRATVRHIDLHDAQSWRMAWCMADIDSLSQLEKFTVKGLPIDVESQIVWQVDAKVVA